MPRPDSYPALLSLLEERGTFQIKPGLERVAAVLDALGRPQNRIPAIHIAGTNGKGSVAAALESVLRAAGYLTGLYTSPHLVDWLERFQLDGAPADVELFIDAATAVLDTEEQTGIVLTHFEFLTAAGFVLFAKAAVDILILETGMGGRWDATNVVANPLVSVITSIGIDHTAWLGTGEAQIAGEKAGIIKPLRPVVSGVRGPGQAVIAAASRAAGSTLRQLGQDFSAETVETDWTTYHQRFEYKAGATGPRGYSFGLVGLHQTDNAAVTVAVLDELRTLGLAISEESIQEGLESIFWPGRFQVIVRENAAPVILDGAHNPHAMRQFLKTLGQSGFKNTPKTFLFSSYRDKEYQRMAAMVSPLASVVVVAGLPGPRGLAPAELREAFLDRPTTVHEGPTLEEAWEIVDRMTPADEAIVVTGSLALVGSIFGFLKKKELCLKS